MGGNRMIMFLFKGFCAMLVSAAIFGIMYLCSKFIVVAIIVAFFVILFFMSVLVWAIE